MRKRQMLWILPVVLTASFYSCNQEESQPPQHGSQQRGQYSTDPHPECGIDFIPSGLFGSGSQWMYSRAEDAEASLCSAMMYFQDAISFQPSDTIAPSDRIHGIRSAMHFLDQTVGAISFALSTSANRHPVYERYMVNMLAEVVELANKIASTGAEMSVGFSDAGRSSTGSYVELTDSVWGRYDSNQYWAPLGTSHSEGRRASALGMLQGWPWKRISELVSDEGAPATLPACSSNLEGVAYERAFELLGKFGVPVKERNLSPHNQPAVDVWRVPGGSDFGAAYLADQVNEYRIGLGLPTQTYAQILDENETTDEALAAVAVQLYREIGIYLKPIESHSWSPSVTGLKGMTINIEDYQQLLVRAWTGAYYAFDVDRYEYLAAASAGLAPVMSNLLELSGCLVGDGDLGIRICGGLTANRAITNPPVRELVNKARMAISNIVGSRSVRFSQDYVPSTHGLCELTVEYEGFASTADVVVYSVPFDKWDIVPDFYRVLSCVQSGSFDDLDCAAFLSASKVCDAGEDPCHFELPPVGSNKMIVVAKGSKVIDMYAERRPSDVQAGAYIYSRHFIDQSTMSEYGEVITKRNRRDCSKPLSNSLGLRTDMAIPLENELTSDSDSYEDAYAFYISRAKEAGNEATSAVERANADLINQQTAAIRSENQRQDALDRIEQICGVGQTSCSTPRANVTLLSLQLLPGVSSSGDCPGFPVLTGLTPALLDGAFSDVVDYVTCRAGKFVGEVGAMEITGLPVIVRQAALAGELTSLSYSEFGGEYKTALLNLSSSLVDLRSAVASTNTVLEGLPTLVEIQRNNIMAMQLETAALVLDSVSKATKLDGSTVSGSNAAAAAADAVRAAANVLKTIAASFQFMLDIKNQVASIEQNMLGVEKAVLAMKAAIVQLDGLELEQQQSLDRADRLGQAELAQYVGTSSTSPLKTFRQLTLVSHLKARRAVRRATKMAFIARKAVEQRLAVDLTQEKEMPVIGEPPANWVDDLFTMYQSNSIWDETSAAYTYVQRLEDYVYNYPFQYPFADGSDTAVISLRDDLSRLNQNCLVPANSRNIVDYSEEIDRWTLTGTSGRILVDAAADPFGGQTAEKVLLGCELIGRCSDLTSPEYVDKFGQSDEYTGSVYLRSESANDDVTIQLVAKYRCTDDWNTIISTVAGRASIPTRLNKIWRRAAVGISRLRTPDDGNCTTSDGKEVITLQMVVAIETGGTTRGYIEVSGAQIEQGMPATDYEPAPSYDTHPDCLTVTVQDPWSTDPNDTVELTYYDPALRSQRLLDSFSAKCADDQFAVPGQAPSSCASKGGVDYLERQFTITLDGIESGEIVQQGQIGGGNYNYRINDLAINLVGSNVKDCSLDPGAGTTCYANQFIPYDLVQDGAVRIRNHAGVELPFKLSVGRIHQAKGLAAERLMTNPLSSTDSALIQQYRKNEFRGRPIQGVYTLRIHAVPSLRWTNVEDVQIVLGYRYWSAFSTP